MSLPSHDSQNALTAYEVDEWLLAVKDRRSALHIKAAGLWNSDERHDAFLSKLLEKPFEEVRVISASLREGSQKVRG